MTEDIAVVETCHGDLGNDHFEKGGESGEDTKLISVESEASSGREVSTLHNTRWNEHLGVFLVDDLQAGRALKITCMAPLVNDYRDSCCIQGTYCR